MSFSGRMRATTLKLLSKYGQYVAWERKIENEFNPITGEVETTNTLDYEGYGYPANYKQSQIDGTTIKQGDILLILYTEEQPLVNDVFTVDDKDYTCQDAQRITAEGQNILYKLQLRQ